MHIKDRIIELKRVKASDLLPNPKNWRTHPAEQSDAMRGILADVGWADAVLARETPDGLMLIDGHLRAETAPDAKVPVLVLDVDEAEADKILATHDPLAAMAGTNEDALRSLVSDMPVANDALQAMLTDLVPDPSPVIEEDEVPEPPADPVTKAGDLWLLGEHRLLCGDSTNAEDVERLMRGETAEMMFADPPYGVNYEGGHFHSGNVRIVRKREALQGDTQSIYADFLPVVIAHVNGPCYLWFADSKALPVYKAVDDCGGVVSALLIWHKTNATYAAMNSQYKQRHESCLYFKPPRANLRWTGPSDACTLWEFKRDATNDLHPTQKPVALAANALKNHTAASVLDPFLGSGTTLIAAAQLGRRCFGLEISPAYCDVIVKRWENLTGKKAERCDVEESQSLPV